MDDRRTQTVSYLFEEIIDNVFLLSYWHLSMFDSQREQQIEDEQHDSP